MDLGVCLLQQTATEYQIIPRLTLTLPVFRLVQKENGSLQRSLADVGRKGITFQHRRMRERVFVGSNHGVKQGRGVAPEKILTPTKGRDFEGWWDKVAPWVNLDGTCRSHVFRAKNFLSFTMTIEKYLPNEIYLPIMYWCTIVAACCQSIFFGASPVYSLNDLICAVILT